ncbi:MAG: SoxR reducing system RseC family protein [Lysobacterales bacterium]|jgi:sigma-E factor negative regulatory protein RseC
MIEQQAQVLSVSGGKATVRIGAGSGCATCDAGKGCGGGVFGRMLRRRPVVLELDNTVGAGAGQPVVVGLPEKLFLKLTARFYLLPLLAGLAGVALGHLIATLQGMGPAAIDALALAGGVLAAASVFLGSRARPPEFPAASAVHVLRVVGKTGQKHQREVIS